MIAHEKGFKFHAQPQTGAYSCLICTSNFWPLAGGLSTERVQVSVM